LLSAVGSLAAGTLTAVPFLSSDFWWLSWVAAIALIAVVSRRTARAALGHGWLAGIGFYLTATYWLPATIERFSSYAEWLSVLMFVGYCALVGVQFALFGYLSTKLRSPGSLLIYPVVWVALELVWPSIFPWQYGSTQFRRLTLIQVTEITGVYGISFLLIWFGALAQTAFESIRAGRPPARFAAHVAAFAATGALVLCFGWWRTKSVADYLAGRTPMRVALIQPGQIEHDKMPVWWRRCRQLSQAIDEPVDLVCWPESAVGRAYPVDEIDLKPPPGAKPGSFEAFRPYPEPRSHWLFGASSWTTTASGEKIYYVSALLSDEQERIVDRYHKRSLVPFGEYIPGEEWIPSLRRFSPWPVRFVPGRSDDPLIAPGVARIGVLICYEDIVASMARASVRRGADVLVNLTNDFWFGQSPALRQHLHLAVFRAVENKRYLLRSTTTGATAVIAPTGRIIEQAPFGDPHALLATVHTVELTTFYTQWGNVFAWACCAAVVIVSVRQRRTRKSQATPPTPAL